MAHTCEDCGETFDTLSAMRLHDCPEDEEAIERDRQKQQKEFDSLIRKLEHEEELAVKRRVSDELIDALDYQLLFHRHPGSEQPWIESMSYGWGVGHPEHDVAGTIETLVDGEYEIWAGTAIEHAMHADQQPATSLVEDVFEAGVVSDPAMLLTGLSSIDRGYDPDSSDHWDWETLYPEFHEAGFDWDDDVRERLRAVVEDCGLARRLPDEWTFADIVV